MAKISLKDDIISDMMDVFTNRVERISKPGKYSVYWEDNKLILETHNDYIHTNSTGSI